MFRRELAVPFFSPTSKLLPFLCPYLIYHVPVHGGVDGVKREYHDPRDHEDEREDREERPNPHQRRRVKPVRRVVDRVVDESGPDQIRGYPDDPAHLYPVVRKPHRVGILTSSRLPIHLPPARSGPTHSRPNRRVPRKNLFIPIGI
jgi:hypothetical protein